MNQKRNLFQLIPRVLGFGLGFISIFGAVAAWNVGYSREPYRYLVTTFIMFCSGILWLMSSISSKHELSGKHYIVIFTILFLGLLVGLVDVFSFCGGECGCFWYYGYPGRWLRMSTCVTGPVIESIWMRNWGMDIPSFVADLVFWSGAGLILSCVRSFINIKLHVTRNNETSS